MVCSCFGSFMSTTFPSQDDLRIPPMPRSARRPVGDPPLALPVQLLGSALAGFGLAWVLTQAIIG